MNHRTWSRGDRLALAGILIALIACIAAIVVIPEVRRFVGLEATPDPRDSPRTAADGPPQFRLEIRSTSDMCRLVEFLQLHAQQSVFLSLDFIKRQYGGSTDLNDTSFDPSSIAVDKNCGGAVEEGKAERFIFRIESGAPYFWGRDQVGDGLVLEGRFIPQWIKSVGQGYYEIALSPAQ